MALSGIYVVVAWAGGTGRVPCVALSYALGHFAWFVLTLLLPYSVVFRPSLSLLEELVSATYHHET